MLGANDNYDSLASTYLFFVMFIISFSKGDLPKSS